MPLLLIGGESQEIVLFLVCYLRSAGGDVAAVYVDGRCTAAYPLSKDVTVTLVSPEGGTNVLVIEKRRRHRDGRLLPGQDLRAHGPHP